MTEVIKNCCSKNYLARMKYHAEQSSSWDFTWPLMDPPLPIEVRFPKIRLIENTVRVEEGVLAGLAIGLFIQINDAVDGKLSKHEIISCQISMKDRHRRDNFHTNYDAQDDVYKILGILNTSWGDDWGGGFKHNDITYPMIPGDFIIFDPSIGHFAEDIKTDAKRLAIDFALRRK